MKREILEKVLNANKNLIINGNISTGKTRNVSFPLVDIMIEQKESFLILDSKEEYANRYFNLLKENNYNLITINLRDLEKSDGWNPLEYSYNLYKKGNKEKAIEYLDMIGKVLFYDKTSADPFWSLTSADFFTGLSLGLFNDANSNEINFNSISNMFECVDKKFGLKDYVTEYFNSKDWTSLEFVCASATVYAPAETKGGIIATSKQKMRTYVIGEKLSNLLNKTTFDYHDIISKPTAIFVISRDENTKYNTIAAAFIEQLFQILIDLKNKSKFNFILDNIDDIEKFNDLSNMLSSGIARNIKFYVLTRSLEDLNNKYGLYINKLSNIINVTNKNIKIMIDDEVENIDNEFFDNENINVNVDYPIIMKNTIAIFDLEKFVKEQKSSIFKTQISSDSLFDGIKLNNPFKSQEYKEIKSNSNSNFNVDDLISRIDKKLEELENEEIAEKARNNSSNIVSNFEKFKTNE